jgi:hypothetical protein
MITWGAADLRACPTRVVTGIQASGSIAQLLGFSEDMQLGAMAPQVLTNESMNVVIRTGPPRTQALAIHIGR